MSAHSLAGNCDASVSKYHHKTMNDVTICSRRHVDEVCMSFPNVNRDMLMKFFMSAHVWQMYTQKAIDRVKYRKMLQELCLLDVVDIVHYDNLPYEEWPQDFV